MNSLATTFPTVHCADCDAQVLLEARLNHDDRVEHVCFHCGRPADSDAIRWLTEDQINRAGYITENWRDPHGSRGCRGGSCGVRQPDA